MSLKNRKIRWLAALLALVMVIAMVPVGIIASGTSTLMGNPETIEVGRDLTARENSLNKGWKFNLGDNSSASNQNFDDSGWADVDLPHDFSITQNFTSSGEAESGFLPGGTGWYRKTLVMPEEADGKTFLLNFDGVYKDAYVYVNGTLVGEHHYGYSNFAIDITERLVCDGVTENVIAVKAVNNLPSSRWYSGSGIYRDVTLLVLDPVHVDLNGTRITTPDIASGSGKVNVKVDVVNDGATAVTATVRNTVYKKGSSSSVASAESNVNVAAGAVVTAENAPVVSGPALWSIDSPNLYTVKTEVRVDGEVVDTYESDFGFRWFSWSSQGFALNGQNVKLNGVCLHHDQGAAGSAAYYDAMYRQLSIMKDMGCNAIRTSHNPADEQFIEICNELGLLVIEEHFDGITQAKNGNSNDFARYFTASVDTRLYGATADMICSEYVVRSIVKRDRNAPAVFAWSYGNEIQEGASTNANFVTYCEKYITWINDEDGTRPATIGDNTRGGNSTLVSVINTITNAGGIAGYNYANSTSTLQSLLNSYGGSNNCIIASETASHTNSRGRYQSQSGNTSIDGAYHLTSYDTSAVGWGITAHDSIYNTYQLDGVAGEFVWTGFDYIGEPTPWNGTTLGYTPGSGAMPNSSYFGIVETTGFEKDTYYLYRSQWNKAETTLHLVTAWDSDNYMNNSGTTPVWLYSNAPVVKLYRNGTHIATATRVDHTSSAGHTYYTYTTQSENSSICTTSTGSGADGLYAAFNVAYTAGTLSARAFQTDGTTEIPLSGNSGKNTVTTPGTVTQLSATANRTTAPADGSSLIYVEVDVLDASGYPDTTAANNITFSVSGPGVIVGVDNGDQATTAKYQNSSVRTGNTEANINAYAGKALVIVRTTEEAGTIIVNVASNGLTGDSVTVTSQSTGDSTASQGLVSYTMVKDYTIKAGTAPTLDTDATGTLSDDSTVDGTIAWDTVPQSVYGTAGDYTINGVLTLEGQEPIQVTAKLHVIPNVIALRNVSAATMPGAAPTLPNTVRGVMADGTLAGEFNVTWNAPAVSEYDTVGEVITVSGTAVIFDDETLPVTCTVRVAEALNAESVNVAGQADSLTQDINGSDVLESIRNGTKKPGDNTDERWSNWDNRTTSADATLTLTWATAQMIGSVNMYYYFDNCADYPAAVEFSYSLNGQEYTVIGYTSEELETYTIGSSRGALITYTFDQPINPVGLKVKLTQQNGTSGSDCVALNELEVMTYAASFNVNTSADLSGITVGGTAVENFAADTLTYETAAGAVAAASDVNAGITVLPIYQGVIRILTVAEDGSAVKTYEITQNVTDCSHDWDDGVITQQPTPDAPGVKTYTCKICGETKTENVAYEGVPVPKVTLAVEEAEGHLVLEGTVVDYDEIVQTYTLVNHGILYIPGVQGELTESTSGRTRVLFSGYDDEGSYTYNLLLDDQSADYTVRAFLIYVDPATGSEVTVYSETLTTQN